MSKHKPKSTAWWRPFVLVAVVAALTPLIVMAIFRGGREPATEGPGTLPEVSASATVSAPAGARFVTSKSCAECHAEAHKAWQGSDHDLAMQLATDKTVRGDFNGVRFTRRGKTTRFFRRDGRFFVHTEGPAGKPGDFEIKYTFGVEPLQQYMVEFPDGRVQVLTIAWDTVAKRWFYQHPGYTKAQERVLRWTGPFQNWNFTCAECHSTGVDKNYDLKSNSYKTTWHEINVNCEACHGPASHHLVWAEAKKRKQTPPPWAHTGFAFSMTDRDKGAWVMDKKTGVAKRSVPRSSHAEVELCGRCHGRRSVIEERYEYGKPLMNTHRPALLDEALYHADGQIDDEVFVYGSFLQSKMYGAGVTCKDCHEPHSSKIRGSVDDVCAQCHLAEKFAAPTHHFHKAKAAGAKAKAAGVQAKSPGASCIGCHMPKKRYMVVDPRGDHSFRVPRPDLSLTLGTPNACSNRGCHADKSIQWSADAARKWYGPKLEQKPHYGQVLHAARRGDPDVFGPLSRLIANAETPGIVRATAVSLLTGYAGFPIEPLLRQALGDVDGLVRRAAVAVAALFPPPMRIELVAPLLGDPLRAVRVEAGHALSSVPSDSLGSEQRAAFKQAFAEYERVQQVNRDRAASHVNLGVLAAQRGELVAAQQAYQTALRIEPDFLGAHVNLADLYRSQGQDERGAEVLGRALGINPESADVHHALGLLHVRQKEPAKALAAFRRAAKLDPGNPRYAYVYGVALNSGGKSAQAIAVLEEAVRRHPFDRQLLLALTTMHRDARRFDEALGYGERLAALAPTNAQFQGLLNQLRQSAR